MKKLAYDKEKAYIQEKIAKGTTQFSRSDSMVQTLLRAAKNMPEIESFVVTTDLRSKLYD